MVVVQGLSRIVERFLQNDLLAVKAKPRCMKALLQKPLTKKYLILFYSLTLLLKERLRVVRSAYSKSPPIGSPEASLVRLKSG